MKEKSKNFFYRINPHEVLAATVFESDREQWLLNFFRELCEDNAETAQIPLAKRTILEAHGFREKRAIAGRASAEQRANNRQQPSTNVEHMLNNAQPVAVTEAVPITETDKPKVKRFVPPTVSEVELYMKEIGYNGNAQNFVDHYQTRNWIPKGYTQQMKDWKAAVRTWRGKDYGQGNTGSSGQTRSTAQGIKCNDHTTDFLS